MKKPVPLEFLSTIITRLLIFTTCWLSHYNTISHVDCSFCSFSHPIVCYRPHRSTPVFAICRGKSWATIGSKRKGLQQSSWTHVKQISTMMDRSPFSWALFIAFTDFQNESWTAKWFVHLFHSHKSRQTACKMNPYTWIKSVLWLPAFASR